MSHTPTGRLLGYAHTRPGEDVQEQLTALHDAGCAEVFADDQVPRKAPWPQLEAVLAELRAGDTLVVCKLIRLGKSVSHLLDTLLDLHQRGIGFRSLLDELDTTDPADQQQFGLVLGAVAATRRTLMSDNTREGLRRARTRGHVPGRPPSLTPALAARARELLDQPGNTVASVAKLLGVSRATLYGIRRATPENDAGPTS